MDNPFGENKNPFNEDKGNIKTTFVKKEEEDKEELKLPVKPKLPVAAPVPPVVLPVNPKLADLTNVVEEKPVVKVREKTEAEIATRDRMLKKDAILKEYGGLESNVPLNSTYWKI